MKTKKHKKVTKASRQAQKMFDRLARQFCNIRPERFYEIHCRIAAEYHAKISENRELIGLEITPHPFIKPVSTVEKSGYAVDEARIAEEVARFMANEDIIIHPYTYKIPVLQLLENTLIDLEKHNTPQK